MTNEPLQAIRDINGEKFNRAADNVSDLSLKVQEFIDDVAERGFTVRHSWLGTLTIQLGSRE